MNFVFFMLLAAVALWALLGIGGVCCRVLGYRAGTWVEMAGIGLAALIAAGGMLNLCRISYGPVYDCLLMAGIIAAFRVVPLNGSGMFSPARIWRHGALAALPVGALWIVGHAVLPPSAFNYHDDFEKYFVHPVRMLQTGTLFGSPLSAIGTETLGGQAVLHEIVAQHFAIPYLFAVDGLFALLLCLLMVSAAAPPHPWRFAGVLLSVAAACVISPVMINISSIYTTCVLAMTALLVCRSLYRGDAECRKPSTLPLLLGMLFAGMLALKTVNAFYLLAVFAAAAIMQLSGRKRGSAKNASGMRVLATGGATALFIMPWLLLHAPHYLAIASANINGERFAVMGAPFPDPLDLLSFDPLFYGSSFAHYTLLTLAVMVYCVAFYLLSRRRITACRDFWGWFLACAAALPLAAMLILALGPVLNGYETNIRYTTPFLIVGSSLLLPAAWCEALNTKGRTAIIRSTVLIICGLGVIALHSDGFVSRIRQTLKFGNSLAFSGNATDPTYLAYNRYVLNGEGAEQMRRIQGVIPEGASVLAWVTIPYHLDFTRNRIYDVEQAGVGNPWSRIPEVEYVMYQYAGYAVPSLELIYSDLRYPGRRERQVGRNALAVIDAINNLWNVSPELYNDGEVVVFKVLAKENR